MFSIAISLLLTAVLGPMPLASQSPGGSLLLLNGEQQNQAYSGVGRLRRGNGNCTAAFLKPAATVPSTAPAYALTAGHCIEDKSDPNAPHEAFRLNLATDKAFHLLGWSPTWDFDRTIQETAKWYLSDHQGQSVGTVTRQQIESYMQTARDGGQSWAKSTSHEMEVAHT